MRKPHLSRSHLMESLKAIQSVLLVLMLIMFINFNAKIAQQTASTKAVVQSTNHVVKGQADILNAIKQVTDDTHTTAAQQTAIIICMLQVPIQQRTTDLQAQCRAQSGATGTYSASGTTQNSAGTNTVGSSSKNTPSSNSAQSNNSQSSAVTPLSSPNKPGLVERVLINPIKSIINAL